MPTLWYVLLTLMMATYVVLDGFDLGVGIIHWLTGKTEEERSVNIRAIGPVWDGNEVWLLASGGVLFLAFPAVYAASFSGFYLPLMIVLWLIMLRGISIEFRNHIHDSMWKSFFDVVFTFSSALLAIVFGAALANVIRGVPLNADGFFFVPLWTDFRTTGTTGVLDWYTVLIGVVTLLALTFHGSLYLAMKTDGELNERARAVARRVWWAVLFGTFIALPATLYVRPSALGNFMEFPIAFALPVAALASLTASPTLLSRGKETSAFFASCAYLIFTLAGAAFGLFPYLLPATTGDANSLSIHNASTSIYAMNVAIVWWCVGIIPTIFYFVFLYRRIRGKVTVATEYGH